MNEIDKETLPPVVTPVAEEGQRREERPTLGQLFLAGPVLPIFSPTFYRHAVKRSAFAALLFFVLFGLVLAAVQTARATAGFGEARAAIDSAFATGEIPEVIIEDGVATVLAEQPFVAVDDGESLVVLDTTGQYTGRELVTRGYRSGIILTRDTLYSLDDQGQFNEVTLREIDQVYPGRIHFNAALLQRIIDAAQAAVFFGVFIWRAILVPLYIAILALGVWLAAGQVKKGLNYSTVVTTGFFAAIPALYAEYLMMRIEADFFLLFTLLLLIAWAFGLVAAAGVRRAGDLLRGERPLRAWRALIGVPMLIIFALDIVYNWERGALITWMTAAITLVALAAASYYTAPLGEPEAEYREVAPQG